MPVRLSGQMVLAITSMRLVRPVEMAKQAALKTGLVGRCWNVKIIASTDQTGYGAIAIALHPNGHGSLVGVALGRRSATEADTLAIELCVKGAAPILKVKWGFRG